MQDNLTPEEKRSSLVTSERNLQVGRRERPDAETAEDSKAKRKVVIGGLMLGAIVVAVVVAILIFAGGAHQIN